MEIKKVSLLKQIAQARKKVGKGAVHNRFQIIKRNISKKAL